MEDTAMGSSKLAVPHEEHSHDERLAALLDISQKLNAERDLAALLDLIAREATRLLHAERASVFLLDREKQELWSMVALGSEPIRFDARLGIAGATVLSGQVINVANAQHDPRFYQGIDARTGYHTQSLLAVPLQNDKPEIIGAFQVLNKKGGTFTERDVGLLKALACQAAIALETAQLVGELRQKQDQLLQENTQLWKEVGGKFSTQNIIGTSEQIQTVVRLIEQIRDSAVSVLITGESGTGKELAAKAIHYNSPRARHPLVALNCAALPDSLVESELFGIERGVATGVERRIGKFEAANGGTLFLDEIGDLNLVAQAKILRVLQERVIERVGGRQSIPVDVRILAATNKNLEGEISKRTFREDLYYRLNVIRIHMPPLREIPQDIPLLANYFLTRYGHEMRKEPMKLAPDALNCLLQYSWRGNVRELENEMKRVVVLARRTLLTAEDLSDTIRRSGGEVRPVRPAQPVSGLSLKDTVADIEVCMIRDALQACRWNQLQAAKRLGLSRQGLIKKIKRYGIAANR
jgi:Nif-specific regulatory protein